MYSVSSSARDMATFSSTFERNKSLSIAVLMILLCSGVKMPTFSVMADEGQIGVITIVEFC